MERVYNGLKAKVRVISMCGMFIIIGIPTVCAVVGFSLAGMPGAILGVLVGIWIDAKLNGR